MHPSEPEAGIEIIRGEAPLIIGMPHTGTRLLPDMGLVSEARALRDTDWWIDRLYDFAPELGATLVRTPWSRSVIDVNRDPSGVSLYPGQTTTTLCPEETFEGEALYQDGRAPDAEGIEDRRRRFHQPYHQALGAEIKRLRDRHPRVVLYDAHAICSRLPRLFDGVLPHLNLGTFDGRACDPNLKALLEVRMGASGLSNVVDGRFKGGWTTRHYGRPSDGVHAVQMEISFRAYLDEPEGPEPWPVAFDPDRAAPLQDVLRGLLRTCLDFARS